MNHAKRALLALLLVQSGCMSRQPIAIMSWEEYRTRSVQWPYILQFDPPRGTLLYYGARHTNVPADPQVQEIERLWTAFKPSMVFNEGGSPPVEETRDLAVERYGEAGLVRFLAARDDIPVASLDPDRGEEVAYLRRLFSATDVKLFFVLRAVAQYADTRGRDGVESELQRVLTIFNRVPGLGGPPRSVGEVDAAFAERLPGEKSYHATPLKWFDPTLAATFLNEISRASNEYRDRTIITTLGRSIAEGQRVFAVVGGTHVMMQEHALGALLGVRGRSPTSR
jgi:hypothetical protein